LIAGSTGDGVGITTGGGRRGAGGFRDLDGRRVDEGTAGGGRATAGGASKTSAGEGSARTSVHRRRPFSGGGPAIGADDEDVDVLEEDDELEEDELLDELLDKLLDDELLPAPVPAELPAPPP
jgi:hypothetical protein